MRRNATFLVGKGAAACVQSGPPGMTHIGKCAAPHWSPDMLAHARSVDDPPGGWVSRILCLACGEVVIIYLGRRSLIGSSTLPAAANPGGVHEAGRLRLPIWACWRWGLPCHDRHRPRGALLPHHFTLTRSGAVAPPRRRCLFCGTFPRLAPGWRYQPPCPAQFGLSSHASSTRAITFTHPAGRRSIEHNHYSPATSKRRPRSGDQRSRPPH